MPDRNDCRFSESHEWFHLDGETVTIGITQYAADELTDITYVEMKPAGTAVTPGTPIGEVESVKTTSDIYCAVPGEIIEVNEALQDDPGLINTDPFDKGWLAKVKTGDPAALDDLMSWSTYQQKHPVG